MPITHCAVDARSLLCHPARRFIKKKMGSGLPQGRPQSVSVSLPFFRNPSEATKGRRLSNSAVA